MLKCRGLQSWKITALLVPNQMRYQTALRPDRKKPLHDNDFFRNKRFYAAEKQDKNGTCGEAGAGIAPEKF